ncbi:MAG: chorismate mutase [Alphaproteobacteria bacterium]
MAKHCTTMAELRSEIDALDRELVRLIRQRQDCMEQAARIKGNRDLIIDEDRIEDVVTKVLAESAKVGLSAQIAEPVWRKMIDRCIAHEFDAFDAMQGETTTAAAAE